MLVRDFYFSINLNPIRKDSITIYIPEIYFGNKLVWSGDIGYPDRKVATEAGEEHLMEMMEVIFNPEQYERTRSTPIFN